MKKRIKKWLTFSLAFMLILGSINHSPLTANATAVTPPEITDSVTGNNNDVIPITGDVSDDTETVSGNLVLVSKAQMLSMGKVMVGATTTNLLDDDTIGGNRDEDIYLYASADNFAGIRDRWNGTFNTYTENANKTISIETSGQGTELLFTLQEPIDATQVEAITFAMSAYDGAWAYKIYDENLTQLYVNYDVNTTYYTDKNIVTIDVDKTEGKIGAISVMCNTNDTVTCTFDGVMIDVVGQTSDNLLDSDAIGGNRDEDIYLYASADNFASIRDRWNGTFNTYTENANKTISIETSGQGTELLFTLQEPIDATQVEAITFAMSAYDGAWAYKIYDENLTQLYVNYDVNTTYYTDKNIVTIDVDKTEGKIGAISVMCNTNDTVTCTFDGVMIDVVGQTSDNLLDSDAIGGNRDEDIYLYASADNFASIRDRWNGTFNTYTENANKTISIETSGQGTELLFTLQEPIDATQVEAITFAMSAYDGAWAYKIYDENLTQLYVNYDVNTTYYTDKNIVTIKVNEAEGKIGAISVMCNTADSATCTFDGVMIDMVSQTSGNLLDGEEIGGNRAEDKYLYANSDSFSSIKDRWSGSTDSYERDDANKTITINSTGAYQELWFTLAEPVEAAKVESITFAMSEYTGKWHYKVYIDGAEAGTYTKAFEGEGNNIYTIAISETEGSITAISVMSDAADIACTFDGVMIDMVSQTSGNLLDGEEIGGNRAEDKYLYANSDSFSSIKDRWSGSTDSYERDDANKTITINSTGAYQELWFTLAEPVEAAKVESITFAMSEYTGKWHYKVYIDGAEAGTYTKAFEGEGNNIYTIAISETEGSITAISVMSDAANSTCTFDGVMIDLKSTSEEEPTETYTITVNASALTHDWSASKITHTLGDDNRLKIDFGVANQDSRYDLPITIDLANVEKVTFNVCNQDGRHNISVSLDGTKVGEPISNQQGTSFVMVPTATKGTINEVVFQAAGWDYTATNTLTVESVVFTMKSTEAKEDQVYGEAPITEEVDPTENLTPATTSEYDKRFTYTDGGLTVQSCSNEQMAYTAQDVEKVAVTFNKEWDEIKFALPEEIDLARCTSVTFATSDQTVPLAYKLYDTDGNEIKDITQYTKTGTTCAIAISGRTEKVGAVAIMLHKDDVAAVNTCVFDGVLFKMTEAAVETHTVTYTADQLELSESKAASCTLVNGNYVMTFSKLLEEVTLKLPDIINMANCVNIQVTVSGQTGPVNYYLQLDGAQKDVKYYNTADANGDAVHTITSQLTSGGINEIRIQCGGEEYTENSAVTIEKVTFTMQGSEGTNDFLTDEDEEPDELVPGTANITPAGDGVDDISLQAGTLKVAGATTATYAKTDTNQFQVNFAKQYDELKLNLETSVNLLQCTSVTFAVSEQSSPLAFKLYTKDGTVVPKYDNADQTLYTFDLSRTGEIVAIGVMMNESGLTDQTCVFDGVTFTMDTSLSTETEIAEYPVTELTPGKTQNATYQVVNGEYVIDFSAVNSEMWFTLPETVNMSQCISVIFEVSGQTEPLNFHVGMEETKLKSYWYNTGADTYTLEALCKNQINQVCVQLGNNMPSGTVTLKKVSFLMRESSGEEPVDPVDPVDPDDVIEGTPNITPEGEYSYQAGTLTVSLATSAEYTQTTTNQFKVDFPGQYKEFKLTLPETIDLLQCKSVTFAVSSQTGPLAFKLYNEINEEIFVKYDQTGLTLYTFDISSTEKVKYVGVMLNQELTDISCIFDGVMFDVDPNASTDTYTVTYAANELVLDSSGAESCELVNGNWLIKFSDLDQNVNFKLPASVNLEKCVNIIFTVATQNGPVNFNVSLDRTKLKDYWYNTGKTVYTLEPGITSKINEVGIQCGRENDAFVPGSFIELVSVSFLMKGTEPKEAPADNNYTMDYFDVASRSTGVTQTIDEAGTATITFPNVGDSITYEIPDSVDVNHMTFLQFLQSLQGVQVNLLNAKGNVLFSGTESILATNCNPDVKYIQLVSLADNTVLTLNSILFHVDPNAYEAIVLNGNFAREDVSMWGAALWGSVDGVSTEITVKTSDTPIYEDIYTYGEINKRSSAYVCFAQDVTARTTPATGYIFSFWAKLSDDYAGAPAELRTVEFSPYYLDVNGNAQYTMTRTGAYKQVLEPGVWTHFYGVVGLPDGATGFTIRIVEQGTNYGQGECLMGSYAVTGVSLTPTDYPPEPSWGKGGGSGTRNNTVTREANYELTYEMEDLAIDWASATASKKTDNINISFTNNYDEVRLKLPRTLDMSTCAWIKVNIPEQNVPIAIKLYYKGQQVDVSYYNDIATSYLMVPVYDGKIDGIGIMSLATPNPAGAYALADFITFGLTEEPAPEEVSNTIVINGDFADEDLSDWHEALWGTGITITQKTSSTPIYDNVYTYATYSRRNSPYQCFAQDITGRVEQNETYTFSFWAKLSDDYKGAPENQRIVQFAPYTVDKDGNADYNPRLEGTYFQVMEPGVWYYFEGTYKVTNDNPISKVVIRILEQGTNYGQGDCVMGSYSVAGVHMEKYIPEPPSIDEDVPALKDTMAETFGDDFITGTAITVSELDDLGVEMLINKHFNAVTIGNELKPDALFNYSNDEHTPLQTITFNGETMEVPTLYFSRAEEILDKLLEWNENNPDNPIKVRGHVLVWHSQTPEWFFREGYTVGQNADGSENYVTPEEMNLRLEWYIKTVLEHFTGEDSPYKDMFYGWDVVNEAVSNAGNGYRTDKVSLVEPLSQSTHSSNSSWWAVYQSNEYILNAFRYANQYAPADVELYYNDYNECDNKKMQSIVKLLTDVKEAEGTRIDGMGMQGHYNMFNPSVSDIERAVRAYAEVVGKVQYTELDMKVSGDISTDEALAKEYVAQAERYHDIYMVLKELDAEDGIEITGLTMWGTVDKYSWLQSSSDVGGGADGTLSQCPLLFDSNYKIKPSYWAFVDYTMVDPDWTEDAGEETVKEQEEASVEETPESASEPEAEPAVESEPVVAETKSSPIVPIAIAVGAVVVGAGAGVAVYFGRKKSGAGKKAEK